MADMSVDVALHHSAPIVVFYESFPSLFGQGRTFCEALLSEILNCIVVCVCQKVMDLFVTSMVF